MRAALPILALLLAGCAAGGEEKGHQQRVIAGADPNDERAACALVAEKIKSGGDVGVREAQLALSGWHREGFVLGAACAAPKAVGQEVGRVSACPEFAQQAETGHVEARLLPSVFEAQVYGYCADEETISLDFRPARLKLDTVRQIRERQSAGQPLSADDQRALNYAAANEANCRAIEERAERGGRVSVEQAEGAIEAWLNGYCALPPRPQGASQRDLLIACRSVVSDAQNSGEMDAQELIAMYYGLLEGPCGP
jgi:hypothetical protein